MDLKTGKLFGITLKALSSSEQEPGQYKKRNNNEKGDPLRATIRLIIPFRIWADPFEFCGGIHAAPNRL